MLSLLISGPKHPKNEIDVYLAPHIEDLKVIWEGVEAFDAHRQQFSISELYYFGQSIIFSIW